MDLDLEESRVSPWLVEDSSVAIETDDWAVSEAEELDRDDSAEGGWSSRESLCSASVAEQLEDAWLDEEAVTAPLEPSLSLALALAPAPVLPETVSELLWLLGLLGPEPLGL